MNRCARTGILLWPLGLLLLGQPAMAQPDTREPPPVWDTALATSFVGTSGNTDTTTLGSDYSLHRRWPVWRIEVAASAVRTTDNGATTAERYLGAFNGQRKLTSFLSLSAGERAESDRLAGIDFRSIANAGLMWDVVRQPHWTVEGTTSIAWNHERPVDGPSLDHPIGLFQAVSHTPFGTGAEATARFTFYPDFSASTDYRSEAEVTAQASMNAHLALKFGYLWRYSHVPSSGFQRSDSTVTASIVLRWRSAGTMP